MLYNLHTHTFRCNHATGEDKAYVEYAIQSGVKDFPTIVLNSSKSQTTTVTSVCVLFLWKNMHSQLEI